MPLKVIIHRGQNEIGGNCIELISAQSRILLDIGQPLSGERVILSQSQKTVDAVIVTHPHQDHYGLMDQVPAEVPVYIGTTALKLIKALNIFMSKPFPERDFYPIEDLKPFSIGDLTITPYLVDHSAFDAYAFLVECCGERFFYTGDFRMHGRKPSFMNRLLRYPPAPVDTLVIEGTMLDRDYQDFPDENAVEAAMVKVLNSTSGACFMVSSSQNLDRLVSAFRACLKSGRIMVLDIYTAWILREISKAPRVKSIPDIKWDRIRVLAKGRTAGRHYEKLKSNRSYFGGFIKEIYSHNVVITEAEIAADPKRYLIKTSYVQDLVERLKLRPCSVIYSMWEGYIEKIHNSTGWQRFQVLKEEPDIRFEIIHTSGHAVLSDLKKIVAALKPKEIVPIHTEDGARLLAKLQGDNQGGVQVKQGKSDDIINREVDNGRGKSTGWPKCLKYKLIDRTATVTLPGKKLQNDARKMDSWGIAFFDHCRKEAANPPERLIFEITGTIPKQSLPKLESLKRRLSYLNCGDLVDTTLIIDGVKHPLYSRYELKNRPPIEVIRTDFAERSDEDTPGRLEKDFQSYLFGKGKGKDDKTVRTNERLAIIGEDFRDLNRKKEAFVMEREFPTGAFKGKKTEDSRILPTEYIDVVSFNKWGQLALIELKVNDSGLQVIAQSLDYALFFFSYRDQLWQLLEDKLKRRPKKKKIVLYVANNCFHKHFDAVAKYYSPSDKSDKSVTFDFDIKKVVLGHTASI